MGSLKNIGTNTSIGVSKWRHSCSVWGRSPYLPKSLRSDSSFFKPLRLVSMSRLGNCGLNVLPSCTCLRLFNWNKCFQEFVGGLCSLVHQDCSADDCYASRPLFTVDQIFSTMRPDKRLRGSRLCSQSWQSLFPRCCSSVTCDYLTAILIMSAGYKLYTDYVL